MRFAAALLAALPLGAAAAPVSEALQRPALAVRQPERAVMLSIAEAGARLVAVGERGLVALSDDRGARWRQAPCPVSVTLTMVRFADARHGVAVGHGGTVLTTGDGGASWQVRLDGRRVAQLAQQAATTPEAHKEAARLAADGPDKPFLDVLVWDARRMLVVGAYGLAFHTADGGETWAPWMARLPNPKALHWYVARRSGQSVLLAGEQGLIAKAEPGAQTFKPVVSPYRGSWFAGELGADGRIVLAGLRGNVWRSADAGTTWAQVPSPAPASITATTTASDGTVLLANQAGQVLRLQGASLMPVSREALPMPAALLARSDGAVMAVGVAGVSTVVAPEARP